MNPARSAPAPRRPVPRPSRLEQECLHVLWQSSPATVEQVRAALRHPLAHTTVMTLLNRLAAKGLVTRAKRGRAWTYAAALDHGAARAEALRQMLAQWFGNDPQALQRELARLGAGGSRTPGAPAPARPAPRTRPPAPAAPTAEAPGRAPHIDDSLL